MLVSRGAASDGVLPDQRQRWKICLLLFLVTAVNYLDRQVFGILIPDLQQQLHITELEYGRLVMAFQLSYAVMMLAAGRILDQIGARAGLAIAVLVWSIAEVGHAFAETAIAFGAARFLLGVGEAANFPACMKVIAAIFPAEETATATGIMNSAVAAGSVAAPLLIPVLAATYGWQSAFVVTGMLGLVWLLAWFPVSRPLGMGERDQRTKHAASVSWGRLLRQRQLWALALTRMMVDPIWYFYLFWLPKFLAQGHDIRGTAATPYLAAIFACAGVGSIAGGHLSSTLIRRGRTVNRARKTVMWGLVAVMSPVLLSAESAGSVAVTMALIGIAVGAHQALSTHLYTLASDLFPNNVTGLVVGLTSCLSALASVGTAELIGRVLERNPTYYAVFFVAAACIYPVAMIVLQVLAPRPERAVLD